MYPTYDLLNGYKNKREKCIWQRRHFEHPIKNEIEFANHHNYIHYNPVKHGNTTAVKNWKYYSFNKFVQKEWYDINWGNNNDIINIKDINYE